MRIFVSIACFLDPDVVLTIKDCLNKAADPSRIVFGVCLQSHTEENFFDELSDHPQVKLIEIDYRQAKGPTYARYLCATLLEGEEFFLQIDCHSRFVDRWDERLLANWAEANDDKAIITCFPLSIGKMANHAEEPLNRSTNDFRFLSLDDIRLGSVQYSRREITETYYLSAAFIFGPTDFIRNVPLDPHVPFAFQKVEQQFYAVRLFTYGWNLFMPKEHILFTNYDKAVHRVGGERVWPPGDKARGELSWRRVLYYYGLIDRSELTGDALLDLDEYGLGGVRTVADFFEQHGHTHAIDKLRAGMRYENKEWIADMSEPPIKSAPAELKIYSKNPFLTNVIERDLDKGLSSEFVDSSYDFVWNYQVKGTKHRLQHYPMREVSFIDNKNQFAEILEASGVWMPRTYHSVDQIPDDENKNYFLKYSHNNGGTQVFMFDKKQDIASHVSGDPRPYVVQEEVENIYLVDNRKFILRIWLVLFENKYYLSSNGIIKLHKTEYTSSTVTDRSAHIEMDLPSIPYQHFKDWEHYDETMLRITQSMQTMTGCFDKRLQKSANCFQVFGADFIIDRDLNPHVIEMNSWPNMNNPFREYDEVLKEFFHHFYHDLVRPRLNDEPLSSEYFMRIFADSGSE